MAGVDVIEGPSPDSAHQDVERVHSLKRFVQGLAISPCERWMALGAGDRQIHVFNTWTGALVQSLKGHQYPIRGCSYSKFHLASCSSDETVRVWDKETGTSLRLLKGMNAEIIDVSYSRPFATLLAACGENARVMLWDDRQPEPVRTLSDHRGRVTCIDWRPPNEWEMATSSGDSTVILSDTRTWKTLGGIFGHRSCVFSVRYNNAGTKIATASYDGTACMWDRTECVLEATINCHSNKVSGVAFDSSDRFLATCAWDGRVAIHDCSGRSRGLGNGQPGSETPGQAIPCSLLKVFDMRHDRACTKVQFCRGGSWLVSVSEDAKAVVWRNRFAVPSLYDIGCDYLRKNIHSFRRMEIEAELPPILVDEQLPGPARRPRTRTGALRFPRLPSFRYMACFHGGSGSSSGSDSGIDAGTGPGSSNESPERSV